jgi:hypothetical protein
MSYYSFKNETLKPDFEKKILQLTVLNFRSYLLIPSRYMMSELLFDVKRKKAEGKRKEK